MKNNGQFLHESGGSLTDLACSSGNSNTLKILLDHEVKVANNSLLNTIAGGFTECARLLLERHKCDVNIVLKVQGLQCTPLSIASHTGNLEIIKMLMTSKQQCDVNKAAPNTYPPLHIACLKGNEKVVELLLSYGADPLILDHKGNTALSYATKSDIVNFIFNHFDKLATTSQERLKVTTTLMSTTKGSFILKNTADMDVLQTLQNRLKDYGIVIEIPKDLGTLPTTEKDKSKKKKKETTSPPPSLSGDTNDMLEQLGKLASSRNQITLNMWENFSDQAFSKELGKFVQHIKNGLKQKQKYIGDYTDVLVELCMHKTILKRLFQQNLDSTIYELLKNSYQSAGPEQLYYLFLVLSNMAIFMDEGKKRKYHVSSELKTMLNDVFFVRKDGIPLMYSSALQPIRNTCGQGVVAYLMNVRNYSMETLLNIAIRMILFESSTQTQCLGASLVGDINSEISDSGTHEFCAKVSIEMLSFLNVNRNFTKMAACLLSPTC